MLWLLDRRSVAARVESLLSKPKPGLMPTAAPNALEKCARLIPGNGSKVVNAMEGTEPLLDRSFNGPKP